MMNTITIDSVFLSFGQYAVLNDVYLKINQHEVTGLLGRNGCGKSCLLKILIGGLTPQYGIVKFNDDFLKKPFERKQFINYLPQTVCHPDVMSIKRILTWYEIDILHFFECYDFLKKYENSYFGELSGGEKRLFEILILLEAVTQFTILDEPFSHIMPLHVDMLKEIIQQKRIQKGIIITDHLYENVLDLADTTYFISNGKSSIVKTREDLVWKGYIRG